MGKAYEPSINEGIYPSDGGWTEDGDHPILLLQIPEFKDLIGKEFTGYHYAWLYDEELNAYIFCFQLEQGEERAVIFHYEHAGVLLKEETAKGLFSIAITNVSFDELTEQTQYLLLRDIEIKRHAKAGW